MSLKSWDQRQASVCTRDLAIAARKSSKYAHGELRVDVLDRRACFGLPKKANDLLFAIFACSRVHHFQG